MSEATLAALTATIDAHALSELGPVGHSGFWFHPADGDLKIMVSGIAFTLTSTELPRVDSEDSVPHRP